MSQSVMRIHPKDNVLVALQDLPAGSEVRVEGLSHKLAEKIPAKHKFYERDMAPGDEVIMYGVLVGKVQVPVKAGQRMSTENLKHSATPYAYREAHFHWQPPDTDAFRGETFLGFPRSDGRVGTANYWLFIPTVFCENRNLDIISQAMQQELGYAVSAKYKQFTRAMAEAHRRGESPETIRFAPSADPKHARLFPQVDGIKFLNHQGGCGGIRQDSATLGRLLASYANHPNVGGVTMLSLGCQHLQSNEFAGYLKELNPAFDKPFYIFEQQQSESEEQLIANAIRKTFEGLIEINKLERKPASLDKLTIGVKCGGSDGFSGISANPAVGYCADLLVALGGKVLLSEFPELNGVEQDLIDRSVSKPVAEKFIRLMQEYDAAARRVGSGFDMNPSPGNIRDGLITDAIKSAGAAKKGGTSPVTDTLDYAEAATKPGLNLVCTPGNDVESTTGLTAAGANLILFTTGLGTPTGNPICPTIKIATNTALARRMPDIIDFDAGAIISGERTVAETGADILRHCIATASGLEVPRAVRLNQDDFIPWKRGVSL